MRTLSHRLPLHIDLTPKVVDSFCFFYVKHRPDGARRAILSPSFSSFHSSAMFAQRSISEQQRLTKIVAFYLFSADFWQFL